MIEEGRYVPPPPVTKDALLIGEYIYQKTRQRPPIREALGELQEIYSSYAGAVTGER